MTATEIHDRDAEENSYKTALSTAHARNRATLFAALAAVGITSIAVSFDGSGDSGQIENIEAKMGDVQVDLPNPPVELAKPEAWGSASLAYINKTIPDLLEQLTYDFLGQTHGGWENNEGAWGEFIFDVTEKTITLDYNERYTESTNYQHEL